jgi:enoyl-CoA hydratase/carnithine racemase
VLPAFGSIGNPLDTTDRGVYDAQNVYSGSIRALADDPSVSLVAVVQDCSPGLSTRGANNYRRIAQTVADAAREIAKPVVFFNTSAGGLHPHVIEPLAGSDVAVMQGARASLLGISRLFAHAQFKPSAEPQALAPAPKWHERLASGTPFTERESKALLAAHGFAVTREMLARDVEAAVQIAGEIGYPVVLKIESPDLPHKTEVGGVRVGLADAAAVEAAFAEIMAAVRAAAPTKRLEGVLVQEMVTRGIEFIAGLSRQDPFGMGIVCGAGGVLVELMRDTALSLCPLDNAQAQELLGRTRASLLLQSYRGRCGRFCRSPCSTIEPRSYLRRRARGGGSEPCRRVAAWPRSHCARCPCHTPQDNRPGGLMTYETIKLEHDGTLVTLTLNRPEKMNSLSDQLLADFRAAMDVCERDDNVRAMIITGAGKAFSAGFDISPRERPRTTVQDWRDHAKDGNETWLRVWRSRLPVVAAVNGYCLGGGCDLSMTCDYTVAADTAQFGEPEIEFCSAPPFLIMPWVLGMKHTKELLLLGERVNASEALRIGLVNRVVPADGLMEEAKKVALRMARLPAIAVKQNKEAINRAYDMRGLMANIEYGQEMFCMTAMAHSPEGQEFRKIAREQGLKAAIRWREQRFK